MEQIKYIKNKYYPQVLITLSVLIVFSQTISFDFVFDDEHFILKNQFLTSLKYLPKLVSQNIVAGAGLTSNLFRPVQSLTHFIDWQLFGENSAFHHITNILIHLFLGLTLFSLLKQNFTKKTSLFCTLFFILHPLQNETVSFISGRGDLLGILFLLLGFYFSKYYWSVIFFTLAMGSKESMALYPIYLFLFTMIKKDSFNFKKNILISLPALIYIILRLTVLNFSNTMNFYEGSNLFTENFLYRLFTFFAAFKKGLMIWFYPFDLHHERKFFVYDSFLNLDVLLGFAFVILSISALYFSFIKKKWWSLGFFFFLVATFPTSNLLVIINALFYDHWYVLPGLGLMFIIAHFFEKLSEQKKNIISVMIIIPMSLLTFKYVAVWKNPFTLYEHILKNNPKSFKSMVNLGNAYLDIKNEIKAEKYYRDALALNKNQPEIFHNLGMIYFRKRNCKEASSYYSKALSLKPNLHQSKKYLAACFFNHGHKNKAKELLLELKKAYPYDSEIDDLLNQLQ